MKTPFRLIVLAWCSIVLAHPSVVQANSIKTSTTLTYCSEGSPDFFAPSISTTSTSHDAMRPIYNRLVRHLRGSTRLVPSLAEHWDISRDGLEYIFTFNKACSGTATLTSNPHGISMPMM
jgi:dipeptide transport system substrate-binding protein